MASQQSSNFVVRFIADLSRYNPAPRIAATNRAIAQSSQQLLQQQVRQHQQAAYNAAFAFNRAIGYHTLQNVTAPYRQSFQSGQQFGQHFTGQTPFFSRQLLNPQYAAFRAGQALHGRPPPVQGPPLPANWALIQQTQAAINRAFAPPPPPTPRPRGPFIGPGIPPGLGRSGNLGAFSPSAAASNSGRPSFWNPGPFSTRRRGSITALPSGASAVASAGLGRTAGLIADIGVVGGLLPEGLGAGVAVGAVGAIGAGIALAALTKATIGAGRAMGTVESLQLDKAFFALKRQSTLLFAEIGQFLLPVITAMTRGLTLVVRGLRNLLQFLGFTQELNRSHLDTIRIDEQGRVIINYPANLGTAGQSTLPGQRGRQTGFEPYIHPLPESEPSPFDLFLSGLSNLSVTGGMQHGGIVLPRPGGVLAQIAEAGEAEAVIPLRHLADMTGGGGMTTADRKALADSFQSALEQASALPPLWELHRRYDDQPEPGTDEERPVYVSGGADSGADIVFVTQAAFTALANKSGAYAIYGPTTAMPDSSRPTLTISFDDRSPSPNTGVTLTATPTNAPDGAHYQLQTSGAADSGFTDSGARQTTLTWTITGQPDGTTIYYQVEMWTAATGGTSPVTSDVVSVSWSTGGGEE